MDTVEVLLLLVNIVVWVSALGFGTFIVIYLRTRPWQTPMGRHVLSFMTAFTAVFGYALVDPDSWSTEARLAGWLLVLTPVSLVVWWRVAMLVSYQVKARREERDNARMAAEADEA